MERQVKIRTFVFITGVPRSTTNEELKSALRERSNDVMDVLVHPSGGFALALYGSKPAAAAACAEEFAIDSHHLHLRALRHEAKAKVEAVFSKTIVVEGVTVEKASLAPSRGFEEVARGNAVPTWCERTRRGEDCALGTGCLFLHKREFQVTVKPARRRDDGSSGGDAVLNKAAEVSVPAQPLIAPELWLRSERVSLSRSDIDALLVADNLESISERVQAAMDRLAVSGSGGFFVKLDRAGGAPVDMFLDSTSTIERIRGVCPLPANGIPTSLERDGYIAKLLAAVNKELRCVDAKDALERVLLRSAGCRRLLQAAGDEGRVNIVVAPWLPIASLFQEVRVFVKSGAVHCVTQRVDDVLSNLCIDENISEAERIGTARGEAAAQLIDDWLHRSNQPSLNCCLDVVLPMSADEKPSIISMHNFDRVAAESSLFPDVAPEARCIPIWRRVKYSKVPRFTREVLETFKKQ